MQKPVTYVLMLLMITPSMVCSMPMNGNSDELFQLAAQPHCEKQGNAGARRADKPDKVMLNTDCMGVDLHSAPQISLLTDPIYHLEVEWDYGIFAAPISFRDIYLLGPIRGSPTAQPVSFRTPLVYLATNRFRI